MRKQILVGNHLKNLQNDIAKGYPEGTQLRIKEIVIEILEAGIYVRESRLAVRHDEKK